MRKRYRAQLKRHGRCWVCQFRDTTDGAFHCKRLPERQATYDTDGRLPVFRFDAAVLEDLRDAQ